MSATLTYEPFRLPAGILAMAVHGAFFALLYFGVSWHAEPPQGMVVDIWAGLPAPQVEPVAVEPPPVEPPMPVEPVEPPQLAEPELPPKIDIALPEKKMPKIKPPEPVKFIETKPVPQKKNEPLRAEQNAQAEQAAQAAQERAAQAAATGKMVDEYKLKIIAKIRRNIVMPPDVQNNIQAEFDVVLLPGGSVLSVKLVKPSGSTAYDEAVERAISKAQPLPLPPDVAMFNRFRELHLIFKPTD